MSDEPAKLLTRRDIDALLESMGADPKRSLGQNFVVDPNTIRRIVRLAHLEATDRVVEIGPGLGSLTLGLLSTGHSVIAIEKDRRLAASLAERLGHLSAPLRDGPRLSVICADALELDWEQVLGDKHHVLVANLPYNVATSLVIDLLDHVPMIDRMLVMVQREVADRMAAGPGDPAHGLPSIRIARWAVARRVAAISPEVFWPRPRVDSALVDIRRVVPAPIEPSDESVFIDAAGFGQRRKTLRRSLSARWPTDEVDRALALATIDPSERAERLTLDQWSDLTSALVQVRTDHANGTPP